jgi:hypothetical protein
MSAIEFDSLIEAGMIRIPEQYMNTVGNAAKVVILPLEETRPESSADAIMESNRASRFLGCMRGQGTVGKDINVKAIGREEIAGMFGADE